jgi:hypothetical protein
MCIYCGVCVFKTVEEVLLINVNVLSPNAPQVICLTEHHMKIEEIGNVNLGQYTLGATFCRQTHKHGGLCIYVSKHIQFNTISLDQYNKEKDLEICALKLHILSSSLTTICIYRSPTENFTYFFKSIGIHSE